MDFITAPVTASFLRRAGGRIKARAVKLHLESAKTTPEYPDAAIAARLVIIQLARCGAFRAGAFDHLMVAEVNWTSPASSFRSTASTNQGPRFRECVDRVRDSASPASFASRRPAAPTATKPECAYLFSPLRHVRPYWGIINPGPGNQIKE